MAQALELEFKIYRVTCKVSGKSYIGQTKQLLCQRWANHKHKALVKKDNSCRAFHAAIRKYGADAFSIEIIEVHATRDEANDREAALIADYGTLVPNGYNLRTGGQASEHSEETKAKMRHRRVSNGRTGHKHSSETLAKMRVAAQARVAAGNCNLSRDKRTPIFNAAQYRGVLEYHRG